MTNVGEILKKQVRKEAEEREAEHVSSGKLSASGLGNPLQWQVLKYLGIGSKEVDDYTLLKFERGRNVEDFVVEKMIASGIGVEGQELVEYRNVVGLVDIYIPENNEIIEVKSTTSHAFRHLKKEAKAKKNHILQACLYAMAKRADKFSVLYVASDDYRTLQFEYNTADYSVEVERIITEFEGYVERKEIPEFVADMKWQQMKQYNQYPDWQEKGWDELVQEAMTLYEAKLEKGGKNGS